jgi:hypothetical protein
MDQVDDVEPSFTRWEFSIVDLLAPLKTVTPLWSQDLRYHMGSQLISAGRIDHVKQLTPAFETAQILGEELTGKIIETCHRTGRRSVKCERHVLHVPKRTVGIERLRCGYIQTATAKLPALKGFDQRILVDYFSTCDVDQIGTWLGGGEFARTQKMACLRGQWRRQ